MFGLICLVFCLMVLKNDFPLRDLRNLYSKFYSFNCKWSAKIFNFREEVAEGEIINLKKENQMQLESIQTQIKNWEERIKQIQASDPDCECKGILKVINGLKSSSPQLSLDVEHHFDCLCQNCIDFKDAYNKRNNTTHTTEFIW